jgi:hypothetical protein
LLGVLGRLGFPGRLIKHDARSFMWISPNTRLQPTNQEEITEVRG